ncbi:MAG TPA: CheR family methyltransferase [Candidatus Nanopelagicales bacterium]
MTTVAGALSRSRTLSDGEYAALSGYLAREAGLVFDVSRRAALSAVVADRLAHTGAADLGAYLARIAAPDGADERQHLLDDVTIPETHFFRNPPQMIALRDRLLPELMRRAVSRGRPLTVWSAGCSSGEEPYSLAILAAEAATGLPTAPEVRILATDVSSVAVAATKQARYSGRSLSFATPAQVERWFTPRGAGVHEVAAEVRDVVTARLHNLVTDDPPLDRGQADLIVCRNVTIYFSRDTMSELIATFHRVLAPGGYLVIGHAETLWQVTEDFTLVTLGDAFAYRKDVPATTSPKPAPPQRPVPRAAPPAPRPTRPARAKRVRAAVRPEPDPLDTMPDPDAATSLLKDARTAMEQARYSEAARLAARAAAASPFEVDAYVVEGQARATVGDDPGALVALRKAVYLSPRAGHARFLLAGALARCAEPGAAAREYRAAAATLPGTSPADLNALLDGCDVAELVTLCRRLAEECDHRAAAR